MILKQHKAKILLLVLAAMLLLSLPLLVAAQTTNGITSPKDGATVSGVVDVKGYASDPSFMKWQLDLLPGGDNNAAIFLATGTEEGDFSYSLDTAGLPNGEHAFRLRVVRADSNYDEYVSAFTIANAGAPAAEPVAEEAAAEEPAAEVAAEPVAAAVVASPNGITSPKDGATVKGEVEVMGYADDPNFMKWQLDLLPGGDANAAIFLAVGKEAGEFSYTLDTTGLPNGEHAFRVRVVRSDSNYDEYVSAFTIANDGAAAAVEPVAEEAVVEEPAEEAAAEPVAAAVVATPNGITSPKDGATVKGEVEVMGYASDPTFAKWQLDLLPGGDGNAAIFLAVGKEAGEFTYTLDTTGLPNGEHAFRLRVVRADSNYDEYVSTFTIAN